MGTHGHSAAEPLLAVQRQRGRAVPEDVSVGVVCPEQVAARAPVKLTPVAVPAQEPGRRAVHLLIEAARSGRGGIEVPEPELTERDSTGPAPGVRS